MASGDENGVMAWLNRVKVSNKKSRETITSEAAGKASAAEAIQTGSKHSRTSAASSSSSSSSSSYSALSLDGSHAAVALKKRPSSANVKQSRKAKSAGNKAGKAAAKAGAGRGKKRQLGGDEEEEEEDDDDDDDAFVFLKTERRKGMGAEQLKGFKDKHSLVELTASPYVSGHCFFDATGESQRHQEQPKIYGKRKRPHMRDLVSLVFRYAAHLDGGLYSVKVGEDGRRRVLDFRGDFNLYSMMADVGGGGRPERVELRRAPGIESQATATVANISSCYSARSKVRLAAGWQREKKKEKKKEKRGGRGGGRKERREKKEEGKKRGKKSSFFSSRVSRVWEAPN